MNITQNELNELCHKILANKIDIESRLITILFDMCLLSGYYFSAMSSGKEPSSFCFEVLEKVSRMFTEINLEVLVNIFTEAYKTVDCENFIRDSFYNLLSFELEKDLDDEEKRYVREGFNNDEELAMYDLLLKDSLTPAEIKKVKKLAKVLLERIKDKISELDHWTEKEETQAEVDVLIRNTLWSELPESYDDGLTPRYWILST